MTIVTIGNLSLQVPNAGAPAFIMELVGQIHTSALYLVKRMIEESLETELDRFLGRGKYVRRQRAKRQETGVYCSRCLSHQRRDFRRNGHYLRCLITSWGSVLLNVPQLECQCGGNVCFKYQTVRPRQRIWDDLEMEIQVEYGRGLSYRQIKEDLDARLQSSMGLRTLNERVLPLGEASLSVVGWKKGELPPVVRVDGIWITVMFSTEETQTDKIGRKRIVKQSKRVPILAAQGVWPSSGRTQLLGWMRGDGEDMDSWRTFLEALYAAGMTPENGLALLVSDGGPGFRAAYESVYWRVPLQRCVFHKLRNVARAIRTPSSMDREAARQYRTEIIRSAARIWQAAEEMEARQLKDAFCEAWRDKQAKAIQTLERDFEDTLTFYAVQEQAVLQGEEWPAHFLRTTSPLERMFREFRRRFRNALSFHSTTGLQAATAQIAARFS